MNNFNMSSSYKNFERLRYRIQVDNVDLKAKDKLFNVLTLVNGASGLITAVIAFCICNLSVDVNDEKLSYIDQIFRTKGICGLVLFVIILIGVYVGIGIILFILYHLGKLLFGYKMKKSVTKKDAIKRFDNVGSDSILMAWNCMEILSTSINRENNNIWKYYYLETLHYSDSAYREIKKYIDTYLILHYQIDSIDKARILNSIDIIKKINVYLRENVGCFDANSQSAINKKIKDINLNDITNGLKKSENN